MLNQTMHSDFAQLLPLYTTNSNSMALPGNALEILTTCCNTAPTWILPYGPFCENTMSSTKPEVHNVLHCRQRRTGPRPLVSCVENFVTFGCLFLRYSSGQTDRHTDTLIAILHTPAGGRRSNKYRSLVLESRSARERGRSVVTMHCVLSTDARDARHSRTRRISELQTLQPRTNPSGERDFLRCSDDRAGASSTESSKSDCELLSIDRRTQSRGIFVRAMMKFLRR